VSVVLGVALLVAVAVAGLLAFRLRTSRYEALRAEEELSQLRGVVGSETDEVRRLRQVLDAIPQGVVLADERGEVVYRNEVASNYADGRHGDALVEVAVTELLDEAARGLPANRTIDLFGPPRRTLVIVAWPVGRGGPGALAVIEDISERRQLDAVRRDFVANISHELRTPVGALALLAETLVEEEDQDVSQRLAARILSEADRVGRTIEDLLTLNQIESEELPENEKVPVHLILAEAVDRIRPGAEQRRIELAIDEPDHRLAVFGDRRQLVSAVYNLLDNAVKYSDPGCVVETGADTDGLSVDISVRDHGMGIPEPDLARIFERFYRVDQARSRQTGGTGLGLAIVRHVATNHHGEVLVRSSLGEGSTFTLRLPSASGPVAVTAREAS
jgi:two-component system sensor histidine kinase SenX3